MALKSGNETFSLGIVMLWEMAQVVSQRMVSHKQLQKISVRDYGANFHTAYSKFS